MSLKDKFNEYKEEKERRDYFRKRNDLYVDNMTMTKTIIGGVLTSTLVGFIIVYLSNMFLFSLSFFYVVLGGVVASTVKNISGVQSENMGILAAMLVVVGIWLANSLGYMFLAGGYIGFIDALRLGIQSIFNFTNIFELAFIFIGAYTAYMSAR